MAVIGSYVDGSNLHAAADVVVVAAWGADTDTWVEWEKRWADLIKFINTETRCRIKRWHHWEFTNKEEKFGLIREAEWLVARRMLCEAFEATKPHGFAEAVYRKDYADVRKTALWLPEDPYYFLLDQVLSRLIHGFFAYPQDEGVLVYCDQDKNEGLVLNLAKWHETYLRGQRPEFDLRGDRHRPVMTAYGSDIEYVPIQAADVLAYETTLAARKRGPDPSTGGFIPSDGMILERLRKACPISLSLHTKTLLQMEADGSAYVRGNEPGFRFVPPGGGTG